MAIQYLLDEHISPVFRTQLVRRNPELKVRIIGDLDVPPKGTLDPEILVWCELNNYILVTNNRKSMPKHLAQHLEEGGHIPGIFTIDLEIGMGQLLDELILIASASFEDEYRDRIEYLPLN
ncbi:DUF5615 family PIN-like protein [Spirulina sp. 06S082]|uniref:DUF5615 family PIN-like protein n=1 Tax=Spirulina sp. 06S082 TaxID=3110248 RepID=UPI002B20DC3C|nr:DUF5615 family PIN-like protein [Spirulina sp. 06S082]MEA5468046.1 DUF5615 family PIN-like protein [Spirulina sp. 06S082]